MTDTLLQDLQTEIAERLRSDEVCRNLTVLTERQGDIAATIEKALGVLTRRAGNVGICLIVLQMEADAEGEEAPGPILEVKVTVRILENPVINNTGRTALTIARRVTRLLHHYIPGGIAAALVPAKPLINPIIDPIAPVAYDVTFIAREAEFDTSPKVATPRISGTAASAPATITITCATAGAAIYYTLDGSYPRRDGATSAAYGAAFALAAGATVRAVAYATDQLPSDASALEITDP